MEQDVYEVKPTKCWGVWTLGELLPPKDKRVHDFYSIADIRIRSLVEWIRDGRICDYSIPCVGEVHWHRDVSYSDCVDFGSNTNYVIIMSESEIPTHIAKDSYSPPFDCKRKITRNYHGVDIPSWKYIGTKPWTIYLMNVDVIHRGAEKYSGQARFLNRIALNIKNLDQLKQFIILGK